MLDQDMLDVDMPTNFHINVGSADIGAFLQFQTVSDLFQTSLGCPQIHTNVGSADIAAFLQLGRPPNFHTNVGSADIAAFLQFQTVSDLFQTSLGCPKISIRM